MTNKHNRKKNTHKTQSIKDEYQTTDHLWSEKEKQRTPEANYKTT